MARHSASVGVVISNFNYAEFVGAAIESVLDQSLAFEQIVVVDDGSTDSSMQVIDGYANEVDVVVRPNGGQLAACLDGLGQLNTDYVYFLDSDDRALPQMRERIQTVLDNDPFKVQFCLEAIDWDGAPIGSEFPKFGVRYDNRAMLRDIKVAGGYLSPPTSGNVYRTKMLSALDLTTLDGRDSPDGALNMVAPFLGRVVSINDVLAQYRVHGDSKSMWATPTPERLAGEVLKFNERWSDALVLTGLPDLPFDIPKTLYMRERMLMISALNEKFDLGNCLVVVTLLAKTRNSWSTKILLMMWASAFLIPQKRLRKALVIQRRSPAARSRLLRYIVVGVRRFRLRR